MWKLIISKFWFKYPILYNNFHSFFLEEKESSHTLIFVKCRKQFLNKHFVCETIFQ
jgi:hypothetical protein